MTNDPPQDKPLVTVVICVYNAGDYLRPAVASICNQTYSKLEILVVDDGSTDDCMATIADLDDPRIRVIRQKNGGKSSALNRALDEMHGDFYAIHDADDLSLPERIECQLSAMLECPELAAVYSGYELILDGRTTAPHFAPKSQVECRHDIDRIRMPGHDATGFYRLSMVGNMRYDEKFRIGQGYDYIMRVGEKFPLMVLGKCLYSYRIHPNTVTKRDPELRNRMIGAVIDETLERRGEPKANYDLTKRLRALETANSKADNNLVSHFIASAVDLKRSGQWVQALKAATDCWKLHPFDPYYLKPLLYVFAPLGIIDTYRARKARRIRQASPTANHG